MPPKKAAAATVATPSSTPSPLERLIEIHNSLPYYYYVFPILGILWGSLYLLGLLRYLIFWYIFCIFFSPHASWEMSSFLLRRSVRSFKHFPRTFSITPTGIILSRLFVIYPLETIFYYIDELLFSGYKKAEVKEPLLILGQPRSGTTKFESLLEEDEDFFCLRFYEIRFPYLCVQFTVDAICHLDAQFLNNSISKFIDEHKLLHIFDESNPERHKMRRLRWNLSDEDDTIFLFHFFTHFQLLGAFPDPDLIYQLHHFDRLSAIERRRMLNFHKQAVQKVMYRRGQGKRYFAKWVLSWCGVVQEAVEVYPDLKMLVMVRNPKDQLRSWFKLQGLLAKDLTSYNALTQSPEALAMVKKINIEFYHTEINFLKTLAPERRIIIRFDDYFKDIQKSTRAIYHFLGKKIEPGSKFEKFLMEQTQQQATHKATETDSRLISDAEIEKDFPDLTKVLFENETEKKEKRPKEGDEEELEGDKKNV